MTGSIAYDSVTYPVVELFHSIQGEGAWMGTSAFFIRLAGCDVGCPWCDTKQSWPIKPHPSQTLNQLLAVVRAAQPTIVVVTGGEPLMHDLTPLTSALHRDSFRVHLETSGAYAFSGQFDWVTLSPKPSKKPHASIYSQVSELKVVIAALSDFDWAEQQARRIAQPALQYLQPEWTTPESRDWVFEYVLHHPGWRMSLQTHKLLGVQ